MIIHELGQENYGLVKLLLFEDVEYYMLDFKWFSWMLGILMIEVQAQSVCQSVIQMLPCCACLSVTVCRVDAWFMFFYWNMC